MTNYNPGCIDSTTGQTSREAAETREEIGNNRTSNVSLRGVLVSLDETAAKSGSALGNSKGMKHAIAVK